MNAIQVHQYGDSKQLIFEQVPMPEPKKGQARVKVAAIGLNFVDVYQRKGVYPNPLPFSPGNEFSGTVDALGEGVKDFKIGDRVATASGIGAYAEFALAGTDKLVHLPDEISLEMAAAVLLQGITAHYLAISTFPLKPGMTALIHAAGGGVGQLLVQIAKMRGARVIGTASNEEKARLAREAGADELILYTQQDFKSEVQKLTNGLGVDVVYDGVGKTTFTDGLDCLKPRGYMVLFGQASGPVEPVDPQTLNRKGSLFLTRPSIAHYLLTREETMQRTGDLFRWMAEGRLKVHIDRSFTLKEATAAHDYIEGRETKGKVVLIL